MTAAMRWFVIGCVGWAVALGSTRLLLAQPEAGAKPAYSDDELIRPDGYREWVYLSSGLGMVYGPAAANRPGRPPAFTNVFVNPSAYRHFMNSGTWPDETILILEIRGSASEVSINQGGHFQAGILAVEAAVKDRKRFDGGWAYFNFGRDGAQAPPLPATASCHACHKSNAAVEQTFVQFYPTLIEVARRFGTVNAHYTHETPEGTAPGGGFR